MSRSNGFDSLSRSGAARRDEILRLAKQTARIRREKRRRVALVAANSAFVVISVSCLMVIRQMPGPRADWSPGQGTLASTPPAPAPAPPGVNIVWIQTDPTLVDKLSVSSRPAWKSISDDELIQAFAEAGKQVGIIRADGHTWLMTR
jgi:hypothetical protein